MVLERCWIRSTALSWQSLRDSACTIMPREQWRIRHKLHQLLTCNCATCNGNSSSQTNNYQRALQWRLKMYWTTALQLPEIATPNMSLQHLWNWKNQWQLKHIITNSLKMQCVIILNTLNRKWNEKRLRNAIHSEDEGWKWGWRWQRWTFPCEGGGKC